MHRKDIPVWIYVGGAALTMIAGCVNAVSLMGLHHQAICHMSGMTTLVGIYVGTRESGMAFHSAAILLAFFFGSFLSGFILRQSSLQIGRRYGLVLAMEAGLLFLATQFLREKLISGDYLAAMACGLQNAMASSYSGAVVRTTHVTGMVTDLGIACGQFLRGQTVEWTRFHLYAVLLCGFGLGGYLGALGYQRYAYDTLLFPATVAGVTGFSYAIYKQLERAQYRRGKRTLFAELPDRPLVETGKDGQTGTKY